jgi:hypothetical protein
MLAPLFLPTIVRNSFVPIVDFNDEHQRTVKVLLSIVIDHWRVRKEHYSHEFQVDVFFLLGHRGVHAKVNVDKCIVEVFNIGNVHH